METTRRQFLKGGGAALAGILAGVKLPALPAAEPEADIGGMLVPPEYAERVQEAIAQSEIGVHRGSPMVLDNLGIRSTRHSGNVEVEIDGRRFSVGSLSVEMAAPNPPYTAALRGYSFMDPRPAHAEMAIISPDPGLMQFLYGLSHRDNSFPVLIHFDNQVIDVRLSCWLANMSQRVLGGDPSILDLEFICDGPVEVAASV